MPAGSRSLGLIGSSRRAGLRCVPALLSFGLLHFEFVACLRAVRSLESRRLDRSQRRRPARGLSEVGHARKVRGERAARCNRLVARLNGGRAGERVGPGADR
jgi:hypothetical protein